MDIGDKIKELSSVLNIPCYYIKRPQGENYCIVYTYTEVPSLLGDNKELGTKYTILFNLYCENRIEKNKKIVKEALQNAGFKKKIIVGTLEEENNLFNTAMQYTISLKN